MGQSPRQESDLPLNLKFSCTGTLRRLQEITCLVIYAKLFKIKTVCFRIFNACRALLIFADDL